MLHLFVISGLCNRLFAIVSAIRYCRKTQQELKIYWKTPVARHGLPYGPGKRINDEHLHNFFQNIPGIYLESSFDLDKINDLLEEDHVMLYDGSKIIPEYMEKDNFGKIVFPKNFKQLINAPLAFELKVNCIVNMPTKPFGFLDDDMELYLNYPQSIGVCRRKSNYEKDLSKFARKLTPIKPILLNISNVKNRLFGKNINKHKVGIHIRRTDLKTNVSNNELEKIVEKYVNYFRNKQYLIFICSDDYYLETMLAKKFNLLHFNDNTKTFNDFNGVKKSLIDLYILASCQVILGTKGSSFSYYSWMLANDDTLYEVHS